VWVTTRSRPNPAADAYALEASAWLALEGHIPGDPRHDPAAWAAWRLALHAALKASQEDAGLSSALTGRPHTAAGRSLSR
jgi:hypothetical protein